MSLCSSTIQQLVLNVQLAFAGHKQVFQVKRDHLAWELFGGIPEDVRFINLQLHASTELGPLLLTLKGPIPYIYGTQVWLSLCLQMS